MFFYPLITFCTNRCIYDPLMILLSYAQTIVTRHLNK